MNIWVKTLPVFLALTLAFSSITEARSGCCSHHGGVCGCGCCDGSSLSSTCAPYYPQCNNRQTIRQPTSKPVAIPTYTFSRESSRKEYSTTNLVTTNNQQTESVNGSTFGAIAIVGGLGYGGYKIYRRFNKKLDEK